MQLSYDGMVFDILLLKDWLREAVYTEDRSTFLYWHHVIEVQCILNDDATNSENFPRVINLPDVNIPAKAPVVIAADKRIRKWTIARDVGAAVIGAGVINRGELRQNVPGIGPSAPRTDLDFLPDPNDKGLNLFPPDPSKLQDLPNAIAAGVIVSAPGSAKPLNFTEEDGKLPGEAKQGPPPIEKPASRPPGVGKPVNPNAGAGKKIPRPPFVLRPARKPPEQRNSHTIPTTDREMRARLQNPRRRLAVWLYTGVNGTPDFILDSPQPGTTVDASTGPLCTIMDCTAIHGQMTSVMHLKFETWEAPTIQYGFAPPTTNVSLKNRTPSGKFANVANNAGNAAGLVNRQRIITTPAVLSHRWTMSFDWNPENYLRIRRISGEIIFRSDVLKLRGLSADQLRPYFYSHAIPSGYVRVPGNGGVELNTEGNAVSYKIVDEQQMTNFPGGAYWGVVDIQATTTFAYVSSDIAEAALRATGR